MDAEPRPASTVMLLRDGADVAGLEVFVLHRVAGMAFAPSVTVFPGGGVDPSDYEPLPWAGPDRAWWAAALHTDHDTAGALVVAAVRELFEETGVLLADGPAAETDRVAVAEHRRSLAAVLRDRELPLQSGRLRPWTNWITPVGLHRRYDTFFFAAALPAGQQAALRTTEAESGRWATPAALLAAHADGELAVLPPTLAVLADLAEHADVAAVMGRERRLRAVLPTVISHAGEPVAVHADGRVYPVHPGPRR